MVYLVSGAASSMAICLWILVSTLWKRQTPNAMVSIIAVTLPLLGSWVGWFMQDWLGRGWGVGAGIGIAAILVSTKPGLFEPRTTRTLDEEQ